MLGLQKLPLSPQTLLLPAVYTPQLVSFSQIIPLMPVRITHVLNVYLDSVKIKTESIICEYKIKLIPRKRKTVEIRILHGAVEFFYTLGWPGFPPRDTGQRSAQKPPNLGWKLDEKERPSEGRKCGSNTGPRKSQETTFSAGPRLPPLPGSLEQVGRNPARQAGALARE